MEVIIVYLLYLDFVCLLRRMDGISMVQILQCVCLLFRIDSVNVMISTKDHSYLVRHCYVCPGMIVSWLPNLWGCVLVLLFVFSSPPSLSMFFHAWLLSRIGTILKSELKLSKLCLTSASMQMIMYNFLPFPTQSNIYVTYVYYSLSSSQVFTR